MRDEMKKLAFPPHSFPVALLHPSAASGQTMLADFTQTSIRRLFGLVVPGGTIVDATDYAQFANSYGQSPGQPGYNSAFDFTNAGNPININDYNQFSSRFGESI